MHRAIIVLLALSLAVACGGGSPEKDSANKSAAGAFTVLGTAADPASGMLTINIKLVQMPTEQDVRTAAERVIAENKEQYRNITVKSFLPNASSSDLPYAISTLSGGGVTHQFLPQAAPQNVPSH